MAAAASSPAGPPARRGLGSRDPRSRASRRCFTTCSRSVARRSRPGGAAKHQLPVLVWSGIVGFAFLWYMSLVPLVWSLVIAAARLVLFVASTFGGYYA